MLILNRILAYLAYLKLDNLPIVGRVTLAMGSPRSFLLSSGTIPGLARAVVVVG